MHYFNTDILAIGYQSQPLRAIEGDLEDTSFHLIAASQPDEGFQLLKERMDSVYAILLNENQLGEKSIQFIRQAHEHITLIDIPIILQLQSTHSKRTVEAIRAGAYYTLPSPCERHLLLSVLQSAVQNSYAYRHLRTEINKCQQKLKMTKESYYEIHSLDEAYELAGLIANLYDDAERVSVGILELLVNAVEHGSAGIGYEEKARLLIEGDWEAEVRRRLDLSENRHKKVKVSFQRKASSIDLIIEDEGDGFHWQSFMNFEGMDQQLSHGRGIALSRLVSFDHLEYQDPGNKVIARVDIA